MPLDDFQKAVLRTLMPLRTPKSVFAGGTVLQWHGFRLSDDQDVFHAAGEDVVAIAERDIAALEAAGFVVHNKRSHEGLVEVLVSQGDFGTTKLQWVEAGSWNFFAPVPDPDFGWRLHMADIAVNKVLAAGGRHEVRDHVDLFLIHRHIMPLWAALWAAPGKDESWSPVSLADKIAMKNNFKQADIDREILSTVDLSAAEIGLTVREALEEAREIFKRLPLGQAGMLFVNQKGAVVADAGAIVAGADGTCPIEVRRGGNWPSGPGIDHALLERIIEAFGIEGSNPTDGFDPGVRSPP
jgi:hypothetical protein